MAYNIYYNANLHQPLWNNYVISLEIWIEIWGEFFPLSFSAWLKDTVHPIVRQLDQRISMLTGLNVQPPHGEYLQVVNYGIGGHYEPHFDHATVSTSESCFILWHIHSGCSDCTLTCVTYGWWEYWMVCLNHLLWQWPPFPPCVQSASSPLFKLKTGNRVATFMIYVRQLLFLACKNELSVLCDGILVSYSVVQVQHSRVK